MLKPSDNPPALCPWATSIADLTEAWSVAQTKARAEKSLARDLIAARTAYYLPMLTKVTFSGGRKRLGFAPLFPGYVFVNAEVREARFFLASRAVSRIIPVRDQAQLSGELAALEKALSSGVRTVLFPHTAVGDRKRVRAGPLAGVEGTVVDFEGSAHVVLGISMLGQQAAVSVDYSLLESTD